MTAPNPAAVTPLVLAGQKVTGALAARDRGDHAGARELLSSFESDVDLAAGSMLIAELAVTLLHHATGEPGPGVLAHAGAGLGACNAALRWLPGSGSAESVGRR